MYITLIVTFRLIYFVNILQYEEVYIQSLQVPQP